MHKIMEKVKIPAQLKLASESRANARKIDQGQESEDQESTIPESLPEVRPLDAPSSQPDPTRYGDWERNGRCIDF
jgi:hypothetical protein